MMLEEYDAAGSDCARAVELDPSNIKAYVRGAKAALAAGGFDASLALLRRAMAQDQVNETPRTERDVGGACRDTGEG